MPVFIIKASSVSFSPRSSESSLSSSFETDDDGFCDGSSALTLFVTISFHSNAPPFSLFFFVFFVFFVVVVAARFASFASFASFSSFSSSSSLLCLFLASVAKVPLLKLIFFCKVVVSFFSFLLLLLLLLLLEASSVKLVVCERRGVCAFLHAVVWVGEHTPLCFY